MKTILATTLIAAAALSLGACSKPSEETNLAAPAEASFNESDIPAEGNLTAVDDLANSSAALDNLSGDNTAAPAAANGTAPVANGL